MKNDNIDESALVRLLETIGGDVEDLRELIDDYAEDAPALVGAISAAAEQGDTEALRIAAHTLKSNARDFGAVRLSALCESLEHACREGVPNDAKAAADEISAADSAARRALCEVDLDALAN